MVRTISGRNPSAMVPALRHIPLFHKRLVDERKARVDARLFEAHEKSIGLWLEQLNSGALDDTKETSLHGPFLEGIFGDLLGYSTFRRPHKGSWDLASEQSVLGGGSADAAIGFFAKNKSRVVAPIELKGASQSLDRANGRSLTPIQQGWDYANKTPESRWVIVSNYKETRLYAKSRGQAALEVFKLEDLADTDGFTRFVALLGRDAILGGPSPESSPLAEMLVDSERTERAITEKFYHEYRGIRARLFDELRQVHPDISIDDLLGRTQTILDRVLFAAFAEDRKLLPPNTVAKAFEHRDRYNPRDIWHNFIAVFRSIDKGNPSLGIPAYNGGLFRSIKDIEELKVSDKACGWLKKFGEYDFSEDLPIHVLGHIFEQSITDLEQLRKDALSTDSSPPPAVSAVGTQRSPSKRRSQGIFYTPPFVTAFLLRETLWRVMSEAWERSGVQQAKNKRTRLAAWEKYRDELRGVRVLDPACGSGAFLVAAFDVLAQEFERVNRALAEFQGLQTTFFDLTNRVLNENLFGIDKSGESIEITKLSLWLKTAEHGKKLTFLDRNIRQGNSVVSDSSVDDWAFDWKKGRVARGSLEPKPPAGENAGEIDARWREGFDIVIGNPPYVRQELLTEYKAHWSSEFAVYDGTADLFVYFFERGIEQLKPGGRLGYIVSNKWLRGGYAEKLRDLIARECTIESIVDFGHAPIFPDADAFPCIITLRKGPPPTDHEARVTMYPREKLEEESVASYVETHQFGLRQSELLKTGWVLEPPGVRTLLEKMRQKNAPLNEYAELKPYYGIKTGCNEAFLVDQQTKERLCREDPRSAEVLKRYLRGQDVGRWSPEWRGLWMIYAPWNFELDRYPAIARHLKSHRRTLEDRAEVKQKRFPWYALSRYGSEYAHLFDQPKIVYQVIQFYPKYALDRSGLYINDKAFFLPSDDPWLVAVLNSPAMWWHNWRYLVHMKDEALNPAGEKMGAVPIPLPSAAQADQVAEAVVALVELTRTATDSTTGLLDVLRLEYDVEKPGQALADFATMSSDAFVQEVIKRRAKQASRLSPAGLAELRKMFHAESSAVIEKRTLILKLEQKVASAVHGAYGFDASDEAMLRETAPPRMPLGWGDEEVSRSIVLAAQEPANDQADTVATAGGESIPAEVPKPPVKTRPGRVSKKARGRR